MKELLRLTFVDSNLKWLWIMLTFEYIVAVNISPTVLSDYPFLSYVVEWFAFIPIVHGFDETARHPEAVRLYIVMVTLLLIPKAMSIHYTFIKSKAPFIMSYVITPYTKTKPANRASSRKLFHNTFFGVETDSSEIEQVYRSMFSRVFWSLITLFLFLTLIVLNQYGVSGYPPIQRTQGPVSIGYQLWREFSLMGAVSSFLLTISIFIIKDYLRLLVSIFKHLVKAFK